MIMKSIYSKYILTYCLFLTFYVHAEVFEGYTLFTPLISLEPGATTYLLNNDYEILKIAFTSFI